MYFLSFLAFSLMRDFREDVPPCAPEGRCEAQEGCKGVRTSLLQTDLGTPISIYSSLEWIALWVPTPRRGYKQVKTLTHPATIQRLLRWGGSPCAL